VDSAPLVPLVFANRVIRQFADHMGLGGSIKPRDYMMMRLVFRKLGGEWDKVVHGDIQQITLLEKVITRWGKIRTPEEPEVELV
jgi:hypothetical protein